MKTAESWWPEEMEGSRYQEIFWGANFYFLSGYMGIFTLWKLRDKHLSCAYFMVFILYFGKI